MKRKIMAIGAVLAWVCGVWGATHEGVQLWENGPLWAKTNIGANSPTEAGYYFWWGDTLGYKWQNSQWVASDGSVSGFSFSTANCPTYGKTLAQLQSMGVVGADGNLLPAYDAAAQQWGDDWRVPKASELRNLIDLCTWTWATNNNVAGYTVTGKGLYSGNSIFLPVAGYGDLTNLTSTSATYIWSSVVDKGTGTHRIKYDSSSRGMGSWQRYYGFTLRPVKSMSAAKAASAVALDTRTGTRIVKATDSIAYDAAWGGASSGTLKVNGTAVSGLSSVGDYSWTPNSSQTNYWRLAYTAGTANYSAVFRSNTYTVKFNANGGSGTMSSITGTYGQNSTLTANGFSRPGYAFLGWMTSANGTAATYSDGQTLNIPFSESSGTMNLYARWTDKWYVDAEAGDDENEGTSASQAFKTIQHAIDKSVEGMTIIVADGTYEPINSNNKSITIQSVNGAERTIIDGGYPAATNRCVYAGGNGIETNTVIRGFTIQNGCTIGLTGDINGAGVTGGTLHDCVLAGNHGGQYGGGAAYSALFGCSIFDNETSDCGGGVYDAMLTDCQLAGNSCPTNGAGAFLGVLANCTVRSNRAEKSGGGVYGAAVTNCVLQENVALEFGGGACNGTVYGCIVTNNIAYVYGGGAYGGTVELSDIVGNAAYQNGGGVAASLCNDSSITGNTAAISGGGADSSWLCNCVLADNQCSISMEGYGGGAYQGELENCLVHGNRARTGSGGGASLAVCRNCTIYGNSSKGGEAGTHAWLVDDMPGGTNFNCIVYGNISTGSEAVDIDSRMASFNCCTDDPHFIRAEAGDFRLRYDSPCIDAGDNAYVTNAVDLAGNPRIDNETVDIGAYEYSLSIDTNFTVQVENGTGGAIYYEGDTVTIVAEDRSPRYTFTRWTGDVAVIANANSMTNTFTMPTRNLSFAAEYDDLQTYLVIDLSGGLDAESYPVSYLGDIPEGGWTDEYKTTKLVLRRIDPGTFTMGSPTDEIGRSAYDKAPHEVTLTHSYYIGVFELTQRQWELVMGNRPSWFTNSIVYATRPVECVSYNQIRGADLGKWWPQMNAVDEASFMGKLRAKTGRLFDLPTEAQWEYACRAGTTTALNSGKNLSAASGVDANMAEVGRYYYNSGSFDNSYDYGGTEETGTAKVGSYLPNAWGLYDMHGNVHEVCLDWYDGTSSVNGVTDPIGPNEGTQRIARSGSWVNYSKQCRSGARENSQTPSNVASLRGLRVVVNFANFSQNQVVNFSASDGTDPDGIRLTWTVVPGTEGYKLYKSATSNFADAEEIGWVADNTYLDEVQDTDEHWYWVQAQIDGNLGKLSDSTSGYRPDYQLTVEGGTGSTNCFATTVVPIVADPAPTGYSFKEWTGTAADVALVASKTSASTTFTMPGRAVTLTAMYKPNAYTVNFNGNKGSGAMEPEAFTYDYSKALKENAFTRMGYTYQGWATTAAGGVVYSDGETVGNLTAVANGTVNLYAVWQANAYTVTYDANGGEGTMADESFTYDEERALTANAFTRTGYTYNGWATTADGDVAYADGETVSNLTATANGTVNLHAVWTANPYTVTFDANGGFGEAMPAQDFTYGTAQNLPGVGYARTGYTFLGWSADPHATAATYANCASVSNLATDGTLALYAVWRPNVYTIHFEPNGAEGEMADQEATYDTAFNLAANAFAKEGCWFVGWCFAEDGAVSYANCQEVLNLTANDDAVITLYAKWADAWYVDAATGNDENDGVRADKPFKTIQRAIDKAEDGQLIIVADGTYAPISSGNKAITIRSVNGADATVIDGGGTAICANLGVAYITQTGTQTVLRGFTLRNGYAELEGGGVWGGTICDCKIVSNTADSYGGGAAAAMLVNCVVAHNKSLYNSGGGIHNTSAVNCTIVENSAAQNGGGVFAFRPEDSGVAEVAIENCIVSGNTAAREPNISSVVTKRSCFTGNNPSFVDAENGDYRLKGDSPCIDTGNNRYVASETDIRGNVRIQNDIVDIGAYEFTLPAELDNVPVEGTDAAVPVEWLGAYGYVDEDSTPASLQEILAQVGDNGIPLWQSWVAGFDPWDPDSKLEADIKIVDGEVEISWKPDLSDADPKRHYTVMGKTNLTDTAWVIPANDRHHFFKVFVTMGEPGAVKDVAASSGTSGDAVALSWRATDMAIGYNVYRATVDDFSQAQLLGFAQGTDFVDDAAVPGILYHYWIVSVSNGGEWRTSDGVTGFRGLNAPQNVAASDGTSTTWITVTWDAAEGAVSYRVLRAEADSAENPVEVGTSVGTSWMDMGAASGITYTYCVVAVGTGVESERSTPDDGYLRLAPPDGVTATNGSLADRVDIAWNGAVGASHYRVFRGKAASGSKTALSGWQTELSYSDTTAEPGVIYYYFVAAAADETGLNASGYSTGAAGSRAIAVPTGVYATDGTSATGVTVSWSVVAGASGYVVYRGTSDDADTAQVVAETSETSVEDATAMPGTVYYYWVTATNAVSESAKSAVEMGLRAIPSPEGVMATNMAGADAITISWQPVDGATYYIIYRGTRTGKDYAIELDTTTDTTYSDESVASGKTYYYSVTAVGASSESDFSAFVAGRR